MDKNTDKIIVPLQNEENGDLYDDNKTDDDETSDNEENQDKEGKTDSDDGQNENG